MIKLYEKYILKAHLRTFFFILLSFFFLYVLIDYSTHSQDFLSGKNLSIQRVFQYYAFQFVKRAGILIPLSLLLSTIKVLCQINTHKELVAFQVAGIRKARLLRPIFFVGALCTLSVLAINEYALPKSLSSIDKFYDKYLRHSYRGNRSEPLHVMQLEDQSKLVYQYYDAARESFFDVLWIRTPDDIWRMKYLRADPDLPHGQLVDHLVRNKEGGFEKTQSYPYLFLEDLKWDRGMPRKGFIPFENRAISSLISEGEKLSHPDTYRGGEITTQILFKLTMPFLSLLAIMAVAPFCLRHAPNLRLLALYGIALFSFVGFVALMNAAVVLGESSTFSPHVVILSPFIVATSIFGLRLARCK